MAYRIKFARDWEISVVSERIIVEYRAGSEFEGYMVTVAATVSDVEVFKEALDECVQYLVDRKGAQHGADLEVDGIMLQGFPVKSYLEDHEMCEVFDLDTWFAQNEMDNSTEDRVNRLCGVVSSGP